jgi:DNA-binding MarR family transcriptional regulator
LVEKYTDQKLIKARGLSYEQFMVLSVMKKFGKTANATDMAKLLDKKANSLSTIFDRMEKKGLLKKTRDTRDRRLVWAVMTPKGREKLAATTEASLPIFEKLASCFSKEDLEKFDSLLEKLIKNTDKLVNPPKPAKKRKPSWD